MKPEENASLFTLCTNCQTCAERCVMRLATPGSLRVASRARKVVERRATGSLGRLIEKHRQIPGHDGAEQRAFEILPSGSFDLVFVLGDLFCRVVLYGPFTRKVFSPIRNTHEYFCIRFRAGLMPRIVDLHPAELVDNATYLPKVFGIDADVLCERIYALGDIDSRQRFIEGLFRKARLESTMPAGPFRRMAEQVDYFRGNVRVDALAENSGMSRRTLERIFKEELGISPKTYIRMIRFQNAVERLRKGATVRLAEVAYDSGYADQSHFIRDFKELSGCLPGSAESLTSVAFLQYEASDPV